MGVSAICEVADTHFHRDDPQLVFQLKFKSSWVAGTTLQYQGDFITVVKMFWMCHLHWKFVLYFESKSVLHINLTSF